MLTKFAALERSGYGWLQMAEEQELRRPAVLHLGKFYPPYSGGMETYLRDLAVRQARMASVSVIVANSVARNEDGIRDGVRVVRVASIANIASMPLCPGLTGAIRRFPADLVHLHVPNPGAAFSFLRSGHCGKLIITHHADTLGRKALRLLSDRYVRRTMERASAIVVTSKRYLDSSEELHPFREKCRVIPLGIDLPPVLGESETRIPPELGDHPLLLAVGRMVPYKGFDVLIRAMQHVDARLALIGAGPQAGELQALINNLSLREKVRMLGRVSDLRAYFRRASIFVMPSVTRAEAFGLVQLEAMAAGLPVINTEIDSGVPEVSVHGKTGLTVPPGDIIALANAIQLLLKRRDLRDQFSSAGRERVWTEFTADRMADRTLALYQEVLGTR